jgi:hypothetical protein
LRGSLPQAEPGIDASAASELLAALIEVPSEPLHGSLQVVANGSCGRVVDRAAEELVQVAEDMPRGARSLMKRPDHPVRQLSDLCRAAGPPGMLDAALERPCCVEHPSLRDLRRAEQAVGPGAPQLLPELLEDCDRSLG